MLRRVGIGLALLLLPLPVLGFGARSLADHAGERIGRALARSVGTRAVAPRPKPAPVLVEALSEPAPAAPTLGPAAAAREPRGRSKTSVPTKGIRVRADAVLRLANGGARPGGFAVPPSGARPAGLALTGVSGLGVGLVDGDVLTHAGGRATLSRADVVGVVVGSRAQHAPEICGRFWRNGEEWNLVVEQPYVRRTRKPGPRSKL
ncbi:MAG: hypothetical protein U0263_30010 [Polyangiaceae bacterium]